MRSYPFDNKRSALTQTLRSSFLEILRRCRSTYYRKIGRDIFKSTLARDPICVACSTTKFTYSRTSRSDMHRTSLRPKQILPVHLRYRSVAGSRRTFINARAPATARSRIIAILARGAIHYRPFCPFQPPC